MPRASRNVTVTLNVEVLRPLAEPAYPVSVSDWNRLMERIQRADAASDFFPSLGWALLGAAVSAFLAAITLPFTVDFIHPAGSGHATPVNLPAILVEAACSVVFLAAVIAGGTSLFYAARRRQDRAELRRLIIEDMQALASRYAIPPSVPMSSEPPPGQAIP